MRMMNETGGSLLIMTNCALIPYQALTPDHGPLGDNHYCSALIQEAERFLASRNSLKFA